MHCQQVNNELTTKVTLAQASTGFSPPCPVTPRRTPGTMRGERSGRETLFG